MKEAAAAAAAERGVNKSQRREIAIQTPVLDKQKGWQTALETRGERR